MKIWNEKRAWLAPRATHRAAALAPRDVRRIAVIKHGAFGDLILSRPFLITLRQHFPNALVTLSLVDHYRNGAPEDLVDRVHVALGSRSGRPWAERLRSYRALGRHELLFDLTNSNASFWISALNPADLKIGFRHRGVERLLYDIAVPRSDYRFEAESFLDQLTALGRAHDWPLPFAMAPRERPRVRPYVLYFPTASKPEKCWPPEHYTALVADLIQRFPHLDHVVLGGLKDWEAEVARRIAADSGNPAVEWVAAGEATHALLQHATLVVVGDTGIRHLAVANHTPTLGIFSHTNPFRYWPRFDRHAVVFDPEGGVPSLEMVQQRARAVLNELAPGDQGAPREVDRAGQAAL